MAVVDFFFSTASAASIMGLEERLAPAVAWQRARKQPGRADKRAMLFWGDLARVRYIAVAQWPGTQRTKG